MFNIYADFDKFMSFIAEKFIQGTLYDSRYEISANKFNQAFHKLYEQLKRSDLPKRVEYDEKKLYFQVRCDFNKLIFSCPKSTNYTDYPKTYLLEYVFLDGFVYTQKDSSSEVLPYLIA